MRRANLLFAKCRLLLIAVPVVVAPALSELNDRLGPSLDHQAIQYRTGPLRDPVGLLIRDLQSGNTQLTFHGPQGYLRSLLDALHVPIESQIAVFSKTSLQKDRIEPRNPRTIFFNDSVSVAWMHGGFIELASHDPQRGVIFYALPQQPGGPAFERRDTCLSCHFSEQSLGVPGMMIRSMFTAPDGRPLLIFGGSSQIDHRTPLEERWGGYYVTGATGPIRHLGNAMFTDADEENPGAIVTAKTMHRSTLQVQVETSNYLSQYSDVAALMVFDHQMHMQNLITRIGWEVRAARLDSDRHTVRPDLLRGMIDEFVDYLLFIDEAPLAAPIASPASPFAVKFASLGPRDRRGRSLRDLDLKTRTLRYPCSYMIYSAAFDALPVEATEAIYARVWQVLSGQVTGQKYARLALSDRRAIVEILRDTKSGLPAYFQTALH